MNILIIPGGIVTPNINDATVILPFWLKEKLNPCSKFKHLYYVLKYMFVYFVYYIYIHFSYIYFILYNIFNNIYLFFLSYISPMISCISIPSPVLNVCELSSSDSLTLP